MNSNNTKETMKKKRHIKKKKLNANNTKEVHKDNDARIHIRWKKTPNANTQAE